MVAMILGEDLGEHFPVQAIKRMHVAGSRVVMLSNRLALIEQHGAITRKKLEALIGLFNRYRSFFANRVVREGEYSYDLADKTGTSRR